MGNWRDPSNQPDTEGSSRRERRRRRVQERQTALSLASLLAIGLIAGLAVALALSWLVFPVDTAASPADFRPDFKADYIYMVSQSYAHNGDLERAQARLALLQDPNLNDTIRNQLETFLREGQPAVAVRNLANLAVDLGIEGTSVGLFGPGETAVTAVPTPTATPTVPPATPTLLPLLTPTATVPPPSATPRPELQPTTEPSFRLLDQAEQCQPAGEIPLIAVTVVDQLLDDAPGEVVQVVWADGQDRFVTGFKAGQSAGYGDFAMAADTTYALLMDDGLELVSGLTTGVCTLDDGSEGVRGWTLTIQRIAN